MEERMQRFPKVPLDTFVMLVRMVDTKTLTKQYKCILALFMSFLHNRAVGSEHPRDHVHAIKVLAAVIPNDMFWYFNLKTFGTAESAGEANPISARAKFVGNGQKSNLVIHAQSRCVERDKN
jgi:hypothetical protein